MKQKRNPLMRALVIVASLTVVIGFFMYGNRLWTQFAAELSTSDNDPIPLIRLQREDFQVTVPAKGEITGLQSVAVPTPRTRGGGLKVAWLIPEGTFVEKGDPVVRFDSTDAQLNLEKQENTVEAQDLRIGITARDQRTADEALGLDIDDARLDYRYSVSVMPEDETIFSKWDIIEAKIDAAFAKERINSLTRRRQVQARIDRSDKQVLLIDKNRALSEVAIARETLDALELTSPVSGLVLYRRNHNREPQVGDQSWPGQVLVEVVDLDSLQARVYVLERDAANLTVGQSVNVSLDALPENRFKGRLGSVSALAQSLERNSPLRYFICDVRIQGAKNHLKDMRPGMTVEAEIVSKEYQSCFVVPASAVVTKDVENLVYIQRDGEFHPEQVEVAQGSHGQMVILKGAQEGQVVALRDPFEIRKSYLPDFSKAYTDLNSPRRGMGRRRH